MLIEEAILISPYVFNFKTGRFMKWCRFGVKEKCNNNKTLMVLLLMEDGAKYIYQRRLNNYIHQQ
jgi:hypothetical protein